MSTTAIVVQGLVKSDGTLEVSEKVSLPAGRVQILVQPLPDLSGDPFWQRLESTWSAQQVRGHEPRAVEEVEAERQALRDEMEQEVQQAMRLQQACRQAREQAEQGQSPAT